MLLNNKVYDALKWFAQLVLPALGTLYFALASIWGFPYGEEVVGTITAVDAFLGVVLGISQNSYSGEGTLEIDTRDENKDVYRLVVDVPMEDLAGKDSIFLKVNTDPDTFAK